MYNICILYFAIKVINFIISYAIGWIINLCKNITFGNIIVCKYNDIIGAVKVFSSYD